MNVRCDGRPDFGKWMDVAVSVSAIFDETADQSEAAGTLVPAAVTALTQSGLLNTPVPEEFGGVGLSSTQWMSIIEELSRGYGSGGWCAMINLATAAVCSTFLDDEGLKTIFGGTEPAVLAQNRAPTGAAYRVDGGYEVEGRFGFGSGSAYANWLGAGAVVRDSAGEPTTEVISFMVPADQCQLDDDWNVVGLKATASVDFVIPRQFVPDHLTWASSPAVARRKTGLVNSSVNATGALVVAAASHTPVALGMGFRALQEIATVAAGRKRLTATTQVISDEPTFRDGLSRCEAALRGARAYLFDVAEAIDTSGTDWTTPQGSQLCARMRHAAIHAHDVAEEAIRFACIWAGSAALRMPNVLGRSMNDITAARCHILVDPSAMASAGGLLVQELPRAVCAFDFGQIS